MIKIWWKYLFIALLISIRLDTFSQHGIMVLQTDFGMKDGAVSAMKGVAMGVDDKIKLFDLTHEIPAYNIWEAALRLEQAARYWPKGTVFVSVVDPGVGSSRKSVVLQTNNGYFFVSPDNGSLMMIARQMGIREVREIDETTNRLPGSGKSYTFHGRDVFAYTAARLASGKIRFDQVGKRLPLQVVSLLYQEAVWKAGTVKGTITLLDVQYGNAWSNIDDGLLQKAGIHLNDSVKVKIYHKDNIVYDGKMLYLNTFSQVAEGSVLCYLNSQLNLSLAVNMGSFADAYKISSGPEWMIEVSK